MAGTQSAPERASLACVVCKSGPLEKLQYVSHIAGKKHQKNLKNRSKALRKDEMSRTLHVTGFKKDTPLETIAGIFYRYEVLNVMPNQSYCFVELKSKQCVKDCLGDSHYIGDRKLKVNLRHQQQQHAVDSSPIRLSWHLKNALNQRIVSAQTQWSMLVSLIGEIELKQGDYEQRELLRRTMENFLQPHFPMATAHVFGSSANNLGFVGCDVDLYVYLGVDPWDSGTKAQMESKARDLTWYIARKLKAYNRGHKVQAIARARVPIIKFEDCLTNLQVDLSFRNGMPVYNTQLICQYTRTHMLVRPYLMAIRYWAKIQDVAGGGQPTYLITNYGLTMLMLFYLMVRPEPIIPSVAHLRSLCPPGLRAEHTINGWDCSFGQSGNDWTNRRHKASAIELVCEFFTYFGIFEAQNWVISPLAGLLLDKESVKQRNMMNLPPCLRIYCSQETDLQLDTAICLQDPFEHSYNITRGLQAGPLVEFQYKCRTASNICRDIIDGQRPLGDLFEEVHIDEEVLREIQGRDSPAPKEIDITQEEIITLDDSDVSQGDVSQDEIEIIDGDSPEKEDSGATSSTSSSSALNTNAKKKHKVEEKDFLVLENEKGEIEINDTNDDSVIEEIIHDDSSIEEIPNGNPRIEIVKENGVIDSKDKCNTPVNVTEVLPENKLFKFPLDFSTTSEFTITFDGSISGRKDLMTSSDDIEQAASSLVHFILQQCLKMEVSPVESVCGGRKRKSVSPENSGSGKRIKNEDGDSIRVVMKYRKVAQYKCSTDTQLWIGRRKTSKTVPFSTNRNPLQYEMAVTEAQMSLGIHHEANSGSGKLEFALNIWQKVEDPTKMLVTGDSLSNEKLTKGMMMPFFLYLSSLTPGLLEKVVNYVKVTSSKKSC